jgi:signal transduction histidine kinase
LQERHEFLFTIKDACERLERIIARMLELAQLETGEVTLQLSPVNLPHLIRETIIARESRPGQQQGEGSIAQSRDHSVLILHLEDSSGLPTQEDPVIQADRRLLENMLFHLLENAWRHSPKEASIDAVIRPVLGVRQVRQSNLPPEAEGDETNRPREGRVLTVTAESLPMVEICIQDRGSGIASAHLEHIFERFHRADMQLTRDGGGLGLGLAICRYIVALHQGKIWVESAVGEGSIFHIQLPIDGPVQ